MVSHIHFLECSGNSGALMRGEVGGSAKLAWPGVLRRMDRHSLIYFIG
jgi:hypothetical protein